MLCALLSVVNGFLHAPHRLHRHTQALKSTPGEISAAPSAIVKASTKQFQKIALPIAALASILLPAFTQQVIAEETAAPAEPKVELGPVPTDFGLGLKDYYGDATKMVAHMRYATLMEKGNPQLPEVLLITYCLFFSYDLYMLLNHCLLIV